MNLVRLNQGRWLADCEAGCGGAEKLHSDGRIQEGRSSRYGITRDGLMVCGSCGHESRVDWPDVETVATVTALTADRRPINQNWTPGEPVDGLAAENFEHGLVVA